MPLASRLRKLRLRKGESLQDLATAVGVSKAHIWELESGKSTNPSISLLRRLSDHFEVSIAWLVGEAKDSVDEGDLSVLYRNLEELDERDRDVIKSVMESLRKSRGSSEQ